MSLYGIDISQHQANTPSLVGKAFVIARASYGAHGDSGYLAHQINVRKAGKVFAAYHFSRPVSTGDTVDEQVRAFLLMAKDADFLAFDWEEDVFIGSDGKRHSNGRMTIPDAKAFIAKVQAAGRPIGLYVSNSQWRDLGQDWNWIASWGSKPTHPWAIWQYDGSGADHLDNDVFDGTLAQLRALGDGPLPETATEANVYAKETTFPDGPRKAHGTNVIGYLPDSTGAVTTLKQAEWSGLVSGTAVIESDTAPKGAGWVVGASKPFTGYFLPAAQLTIAAAVDPTPYSSADVAAAVEAAIKTDRAAAKIVWPA